MSDLTNYGTGYPTYTLITDDQVAGANKKFLDFFNAAGTDKRIILLGWYVIIKTDVAVTGALGVRFDLYRTNTVGTGGTAALYKSPLPNATTISPRDTRYPALPSGITARSVPTGGATIDHYLTRTYAFPEETNTAGTLTQLINVLDDNDSVGPIVLNQGEGIYIQQGAVASVNSFAHEIIFGVIDDYQ